MLKLSLVAAAAAFALAAIPAAPAMAQLVPIDNPGCDGPCRVVGGDDGEPNRGRVDYSTQSCSNTLGVFPRVYPADIQGVDRTYRVWVTEVCQTGDLLQNEGNAAYLRRNIEQNPVIVAALNGKSFGTGDVYAVKLMGDDTINLYVHRFGR